MQIPISSKGWGEKRVNIQLMDNNRRIISKLVSIALGEDVLVLSQKCSERLLYQWAGKSVDPSRSLWPRIVEEDLL